MMQTALAVTLLLLLNEIGDEPEKGDVLCVGASSVTASIGAQGCRPEADVIEPKDVTRAFIVIGPHGKTIRIGELPAGATSLPDLDKQSPLKFIITAQETVRFGCV